MKNTFPALILFSLVICLCGTIPATAGLTFESALRTILERDTEIAAQKSLTAAVEAEGMYRRYTFLPSLSLDGTQEWLSSGNRLTYALLNTKMNLFRFGADDQALKAQRARERAALAKLEKTRLEREKFAAQSLFAYLRLAREKEIFTSLEHMEMESVRVAERQFESGRIPIQEVQKVKIDLENVRARVAGNSIEFSDAKAVLVSLLGNSEIETEWPWKDRITRTSSRESLNPQADASQRPDWIEAQSTVVAQDHVASQAFRTLFPSLDASFGYGKTRDYFLGDDFRTGWTGMLTLSIPLFSRFEQYSNYRAQTETRGYSEALLEGTKRKIESEFATVPARFETAKRTALSRDEILKISAKLYQDNLLRYRQGRANSNELNVDLNRYLDTQLNAVSGWLSAHLALVDLYHLTGKSVLQ